MDLAPEVSKKRRTLAVRKNDLARLQQDPIGGSMRPPTPVGRTTSPTPQAFNVANRAKLVR